LLDDIFQQGTSKQMAQTPGSEPEPAQLSAPKHPFDDHWYLHISGKTDGPFTGYEIQRMVEEKKVSATDLAYGRSSSAWTQIVGDPILATLFAQSETHSKASPGMRTRSGLRLFAIALTLVVAVIGWIAWPYYTVYQLAAAVRNGDTLALEKKVAWDSIRQGLRDDLNAMLLRKLSTDAKADTKPGAALGTRFAAVVGPAIVDRMITNFVTPEAIANFAQTNRKSAAHIDNFPATAKLSDAIQTAQRFRWDQVKYAFFSGNPLTFKVEFIPDQKAKTESPITLIFNWDGNWRLNRLKLPLDIMSSPSVTTAISDNKTKSEISLPSSLSSSQSTSIPKAPPPVSVSLVSKYFKDRNIRASDFDAEIMFQLSIKNETD
jgi:hypothetical protein